MNVTKEKDEITVTSLEEFSMHRTVHNLKLSGDYKKYKTLLTNKNIKDAVTFFRMNNKTIKTILLNNNDLTGLSCRYIHQTDLQTLTTLDLSANKIGLYGCKTVASFFSKMPSLSSVKLSDVGMNHEGVKHICNGLLGPSGVKTICLNLNGMLTKRNEAAASIANMLARNNTLTSLNISNMKFLSSDMLKISQGIQCNHTLRELDMTQKALINPQHEKIFRERITNSPMLERVFLPDGCSFDLIMDMEHQFMHARTVFIENNLTRASTAFLDQAECMHAKSTSSDLIFDVASVLMPRIKKMKMEDCF